MSNSTKTVSETLLAIRSEIYDLQQKREILIQEKREIQSRLTKVKNLVRTSGLMPTEKYKQCCDAQSKYVSRIQAIEKDLGNLKLQIQKLADDEYNHRGKPSGLSVDTKPQAMGKECIESLVALREKYQQFSADHTRVSSMRTMAAEFAFQLNPIIKAALKS
jgi:hypothetical protein